MAYPAPHLTNPERALTNAREALQASHQWSANQQMGRRWAVACVALEITQRCNLDCSLCYLSEKSESVRDLPFGEVLRRVDLILRQYGAGTNVQITGGEPTLRASGELIEIVRYVRDRAMLPTLMTNGIRARRPLLAALAESGLADVAFHVDTTQHRKGYDTERDLNELRERYLERTRGLPISVMFNTTVHAGNYREVPALAAYFAARVDRIRTASFQLQADTGRGRTRGRPQVITPDNVTALIAQGARTRINFEAVKTGHVQCNRYALCIGVDGRLHNLFDDTPVVRRLIAAMAGLELDRTRPGRTLRRAIGALLAQPSLLAAALRWILPKLWHLRRNLLAARGRVYTLSFVVHNFMHACDLDPSRIAACAFPVMTRRGPLSMCLHNAERDRYILERIPLQGPVGGYWLPLTGEVATDARALARARALEGEGPKALETSGGDR